jgi:hypothetical protein
MTAVRAPGRSGDRQTQETSRRGGGGFARFLREHSLALVAFGVFLLVWIGGQVLTGHRAFNEEQRAHAEPTVSLPEYLTHSEFGEATFENWESEFLQMGVYVLLTAWLVQRGSSESKPPEGDPALDADPRDHRDDPGAPWPVRRGGWVLRLYAQSLSIALLGLFGLAFVGHLVTGAHAYSAEQAAHGEPRVSVLGYLLRAQFWFESFQNWQSEFMAVGTLVVLSVYLRQRGSSESKPVHAPHHKTGAD